MFIEILVIVFPILLDTSNNVPISHAISCLPFLKNFLSEFNNFTPVMSSANMRTMISPLEVCNEVCCVTQTGTITESRFDFTMIEKKLQFMATL